MPVVQGITLSLFTFALAGFLLTFLSPARDVANTYAVAISSGSGLQLTTRLPADVQAPAAQAQRTGPHDTGSSRTPNAVLLVKLPAVAQRQLTCANVRNFIGIEVGTQCGPDTIEIAAQD